MRFSPSSPFTQTVAILNYHHVGDPPPQVRIKGLYVTPAQLAWQIAKLKKAGWHFGNFRQLVEAEASSETSRRWVILTFDDGYLDNYTLGWPILREAGVTAVIYPVVGAIGARGLIWPENQEQTAVDLLTAPQICEMSAAGLEFGSHAWDHTHLANHRGESLKSQLSRSKSALEALLQEPVLSVAYPFGSYNSEVMEAAAHAGYRYGVTTEGGLNAPAANPWGLHRWPVKGHRWNHRWQFKRLLNREFRA